MGSVWQHKLYNIHTGKKNDIVYNINQNIIRITQTLFTISDINSTNIIVDISIVILISNICNDIITTPFIESVSIIIMLVLIKYNSLLILDILDMFNNLLNYHHVDELSEIEVRKM